MLGPTTRARWSYGASKAIDEFLALAYWRERRLPVVVGRLFNVVGPRQTGAYGMVLPRFVDAALAGRPLVVHDDGRQQRCFAHVSDVVRHDPGPDGLPAGRRRRVQHRQRPAGEHFGVGPASDLPRSIRRWGSSLSATPRRTTQDFEDCRRRVPDLTKLRKLTGLRAKYGLDDIIRELVEWKRERM